ncbi:hypothetical protein LQZ18_04155 [Lachnospiraceae bacterium ZAX-1]
MMIAYICSPYRAKNDEELTRNIEYAQELQRDALLKGYAPIVPHLSLTQSLDDNDPQERKIGIDAGLELLEICDGILVGDRYGISEGMEAEIKKAEELGFMWR